MLPALLGVLGLTLAGLLWWLLTLPGAKPRPLSPALISAPPLSSAEGEPGAAPAAPASLATPATNARSAAAAPAAGGTGQTLTLKFSGESWVQIADGRGHTLLDGLQPAGSTRAVTGPAPLRVVLGNAPAVALEVNGRPASLAGLVRRRGDAHVSIDASGAVSPALSPAAGGN
jgi:cytoskeleton protein RodZ